MGNLTSIMSRRHAQNDRYRTLKQILSQGETLYLKCKALRLIKLATSC